MFFFSSIFFNQNENQCLFPLTLLPWRAVTDREFSIRLTSRTFSEIMNQILIIIMAFFRESYLKNEPKHYSRPEPTLIPLLQLFT